MKIIKRTIRHQVETIIFGVKNIKVKVRIVRKIPKGSYHKKEEAARVIKVRKLMIIWIDSINTS